MRPSIEDYNERYKQDVLEKMNRCDTTCLDLGMRPYRSSDANDVDWYIENMPAVNYALDRLMNYFFANGLSTGGEESDNKLDRWLYEQKTLSGSTNNAELRQCIRRAVAYGECGLREYEGNIYHVPVGYYGILLDRQDGIDRVVAYFVRKDREKVTDIGEEWKKIESYDQMTKWFDENGYILLTSDQFIVLRNDTSTLDPKSPFLSDKLRLDLLSATYDQLNYDIRYDGPGRIFFRVKSGYAVGDDNDISTGEVLNTEPKSEKLKKAKKEVVELMSQVKNSSSDSVGVLSYVFSDDYIYLPRVTKGTEFLDWLKADTVIMAQVLGMSPTLLEVGDIHGNVSMEKIIDNAMVNTIVPARESYATQFSSFISKIVGVSKVYFNKYDMLQIDNENDSREKLAYVIRNLSLAMKSNESDNVKQLIDEVADVLRSSLYDTNDTLKTMN